VWEACVPDWSSCRQAGRERDSIMGLKKVALTGPSIKCTWVRVRKEARKEGTWNGHRTGGYGLGNGHRDRPSVEEPKHWTATPSRCLHKLRKDHSEEDDLKDGARPWKPDRRDLMGLSVTGGSRGDFSDRRTKAKAFRIGRVKHSRSSRGGNDKKPQESMLVGQEQGDEISRGGGRDNNVGTGRNLCGGER